MIIILFFQCLSIEQNRKIILILCNRVRVIFKALEQSTRASLPRARIQKVERDEETTVGRLNFHSLSINDSSDTNETMWMVSHYV